MGLFDFLGKSKRDKENAQLIAGVSFEECLEDLLGENPDEMRLRSAATIMLTATNARNAVPQ